MKNIIPYLNFLGNTEEAFTFYKSIFGGEFTTFQRFKDIPNNQHLSNVDQEKIMHVSLELSNGYVLMGTDMLESMGHKLVEGNNFSLSINADSESEADFLFNSLVKGGKIDMPLEKTFWGAYFGIVKDKFGIQWLINYDYPNK